MLRTIRLLSKFHNYSTLASDILKTPLYNLHESLNAQFVDFAGFAMPVLYKGMTHIQSHKWVREKAGLFDVSHMLQHHLSGPDATAFLEKITPSDFKALKPFTSTLSVLLNDKGGIVDDTMISKHDDNNYYIVTNAGCRSKDLTFIANQMKDFSKITHKIIDGTLLALQGPQAAFVLQKFTSFDLSQLKFGQVAFISFTWGKYHVARGGYTGEDGFEISIPDKPSSIEFAKALLDHELVIPVGLASRDSLRLEASMCLYGNELSESLTPVEAGLTWVVAKSRRHLDQNSFNGAATILNQINNKSNTKVRVGICNEGPAARSGALIFDEADKKIGIITSGCKSPTLDKNISMGYVEKPYNRIGTKLLIELRNKKRTAEVVKMPFVTPRYFK